MLKIFSPIVAVANNGEEKFTSFRVLHMGCLLLRRRPHVSRYF